GGGVLDAVGHVDDGQARPVGDRGGGLVGSAPVDPRASLLDDAPGGGVGPGEAGGEQRDVEPVPAHRAAAAAGRAVAPSRLSRRPCQACSGWVARSSASTARSTRGSSASPWTTAMSSPSRRTETAL